MLKSILSTIRRHQPRRVPSTDQVYVRLVEKIEVEAERVEALAVRLEAHHHRDVRPPHEPACPQPLDDLLQRWPDLRHGVVVHPAEEDGEQELYVEVRVVDGQRVVDGVGHVDAVLVGERAPAQAVRQTPVARRGTAP